MTKKTPLEQGKTAFRVYKLAEQNPYPVGSPEHEQWDTGYKAMQAKRNARWAKQGVLQ